MRPMPHDLVRSPRSRMAGTNCGGAAQDSWRKIQHQPLKGEKWHISVELDDVRNGSRYGIANFGTLDSEPNQSRSACTMAIKTRRTTVTVVKSFMFQPPLLISSEKCVSISDVALKSLSQIQTRNAPCSPTTIWEGRLSINDRIS